MRLSRLVRYHGPDVSPARPLNECYGDKSRAESSGFTPGEGKAEGVRSSLGGIFYAGGSVCGRANLPLLKLEFTAMFEAHGREHFSLNLSRLVYNHGAKNPFLLLNALSQALSNRHAPTVIVTALYSAPFSGLTPAAQEGANRGAPSKGKRPRAEAGLSLDGDADDKPGAHSSKSAGVLEEAKGEEKPWLSVYDAPPRDHLPAFAAADSKQGHPKTPEGPHDTPKSVAAEGKVGGVKGLEAIPDVEMPWVKGLVARPGGGIWETSTGMNVGNGTRDEEILDFVSSVDEGDDGGGERVPSLALPMSEASPASVAEPKDSTKSELHYEILRFADYVALAPGEVRHEE